MDERKKVSAEERDELFAELRWNILIARLKITLDQEMNRESTPRQKALAAMKLQPVRSRQQRPVTGRTCAKIQQQAIRGRRGAMAGPAVCACVRNPR